MPTPIPSVQTPLTNDKDDPTCNYAWRVFFADQKLGLDSLSSSVTAISTTVNFLSSSVNSIGYGAFQADRNNISQSVLAGGAVIQFNHEAFDVSGVFDTSTFRYKPQIAGYYTVHISMDFANNVAGSYPEALINKNGSTVVFGTWTSDSLTQTISTAQGLIHMNGTTDYIEGFASTDAGSIHGDPTETFMNGWLVRAD